jgi:hypothetical protein
LRAALALALTAQSFFLLALGGELRVVPILAVTVISCLLSVIGHARTPTTDNRQLTTVFIVLFAALLLLALHPPIAFDETLYHLPFIRSLATTGTLRFLPDVRFAAIPQFQELLAVPLYLLGGGVATHLLALIETLITAAILFEWGRRYGERTGWLAAAFFLGGPIVLQLATVTYNDAALTLFVAAGFYCLDREELALSGLFLGTACSVKYLGGYFAVAALVIVAFRARHRIAAFVACCVAAAAPTTLWLVATTGNPVFPFMTRIFGENAWWTPFPPVSAPDRLMRTLRIVWDVTFARERVNFQPPFTPLLIPAIALVIAAAIRDARARWVAAICGVYVVAFAFLPQDARYLVALMPLVSIAAAAAFTARWPRYAMLLAWIAIAPGLLYAAYRLQVNGFPPVTAAAREAELARRVPEYRAVMRAGTGRIYVCGGEQLQSYARGQLLGDFFGPYSYARVLAGAKDTASIAERLRPIRADYFLVATRVCPPPRATGGMELVYADGGAQLWRVQASNPQPR